MHQPRCSIGLWIRAVCLLAATPIFLFAIEPWDQNPWYWSHDGKPVLLLGGSDDDNLFQWGEVELTRQLDRIVAAGGNVIRNTMSDRKDKGFEVYPFKKLANGRYDLKQWNPEYWKRFERLLQETARRNIFVQIEIWDRFDYTDNRQRDSQRWEKHPYSPANNINYTFAETGFARRYPEHPGANKQIFFFTTPQQRYIKPVLAVQERFVHKLLEHSLKYDHLLYCIDNETKAEPQWAEHWARFVKLQAKMRDKKVMVTEMWDDWNLKAKRHRQTFDHPQLYDFVDVSQNNHNHGQLHWDNFQYVRNYLQEHPRPINTTKTYGADGNKFKHTDQDAIERFWRHLLAGAASIRFHRPDSGLGINDKAVTCIQAARKLEGLVPLWRVHSANHLLSNRVENEAYVAASSTKDTFVFYFPKQEESRGEVTLECGGSKETFQLHWIAIDSVNHYAPIEIEAGDLKLRPPDDGNFTAALIKTE